MGRFAAAESLNATFTPPGITTAMGSLINHITSGGNEDNFQPMNVNFGLFPPLEKKINKKARKAAYSKRAIQDFDTWLESA